MSMECTRILLAPLCLYLLLSLGVVADENVTLRSMTIYDTHEWFSSRPEVYFQCEGEDEVHLPDIQAKGRVYSFLGSEPWQPLVTLVGNKCKLCRLYEKNAVQSDDLFEQWELCPFNFSPSPEGLYARIKEKEFNLTLLCPNCNVVPSDQVTVSERAGKTHDEGETDHHGLTAIIVIFALLSLGGFGFVAYSQWRQKQRENQQARFIKLFEDEDFLDDELGLKEGL